MAICISSSQSSQFASILLHSLSPFLLNFSVHNPLAPTILRLYLPLLCQSPNYVICFASLCSRLLSTSTSFLCLWQNHAWLEFQSEFVNRTWFYSPRASYSLLPLFFFYLLFFSTFCSILFYFLIWWCIAHFFPVLVHHLN